MMTKRCMGAIVFVTCLSIALAAESYKDYEAEDVAERQSENLNNLFRLYLQRNLVDNVGGIPIQHLMIRKSQRSPSYRLRFGRSNGLMPASSGMETSEYENN
ncbi:short neuropeptide F [Orussus abietinus]|uniref:short neuropeptide F n=1 Tax=Orussus abietinus TaxID=222816 RepID=UPI00062571C7|nr:short neuropeptide F [Orussus abietinus]